MREGDLGTIQQGLEVCDFDGETIGTVAHLLRSAPATAGEDIIEVKTGCWASIPALPRRVVGGASSASSSRPRRPWSAGLARGHRRRMLGARHAAAQAQVGEGQWTWIRVG